MDGNARTTEPGRLASELSELLDQDRRAELAKRANAANPIDLARCLSDLEDEEKGAIFDLLAGDRPGIVLSETDPETQAFLLMHVGELRARLVSTLEPDDAADVLDALEDEEREALLDELETADAEEIRALAEHEADSAGGLMTTEYVEVGPEMTVNEVLAALRGADEAETIHNIYVTAYGRLVGVFSVRDLIRARPDARVEEFMTTTLITAAPADDQEQVLRLMETYHLGLLPVVGSDGRLMGIVTHDDALTAMEEEANEDVLRLAGTSSGLLTQQTVLERVRARLPWLMITLGGGTLAALVIQGLGGGMVEPISRFLPVVGGMGGNVAMQSAAILVRGFATGEIDATRLRRLLAGEIAVGFLIGLVCGVGGGLIAFLLTEPAVAWRVAGSVAVALLGASTLAAAAGTLIPTLCERLGIDPAISAGPFITTLNDILGFAVYMAVAAAILQAGA